MTGLGGGDRVDYRLAVHTQPGPQGDPGWPITHGAWVSPRSLKLNPRLQER